VLFRPDDSRPLDLAEEEEWDDMLEMGRNGYIARRTGTVLANSILPIGMSVWALWWTPRTRPYVGGPFTWIPLAIGTVLLGSLAAAHAWDTWRSYERRAVLEVDERRMDAVARLSVRTGRYARRSALLSTLAFGLMFFAHPPFWVMGVMGTACLLSWRSLVVHRRGAHLLQPKK
jgi:hypothetical protein